MNDPNKDRINTPKVNAILDKLREVRAKGFMSVGWNDNEICPPFANNLVKAGLVKFETNLGVKIVVPV